MKKTTYFKFFTNLVLGLPLLSVAQTTQAVQIPDSGFERNLIDEGYDSDGTINGTISKSDALNVTSMPFLTNNSKTVKDLTGINEFTNLTSLAVSLNDDTPPSTVTINLNKLVNLKDIHINTFGLSSLDATPLLALEKLKIENLTIDFISKIKIRKLDFSNSPNFKNLDVKELYYLEVVNLRNNKSGSVSLLLGGTINNVCIEVDDVVKATNKQAPYDTWTVIGKHYFSDVCTLSVEKFVKENFKIYPNPTSEYVVIDQNDTENVQLQSVQVIDSTGKWIRTVNENFNYIDVSNLSSGTYLFVIQTNKGNKVEKVVIK